MASKLDKLKGMRVQPANNGKAGTENETVAVQTNEIEKSASNEPRREKGANPSFSMSDLYLTNAGIGQEVTLVDSNKNVIDEAHGIKLFKSKASSFYVMPQVRSEIADDEVDSMADSLLANGQYQPVKVAPPDQFGEHKGKYRVIIGGTRHAGASKLEEMGHDFELWAIVDPEAPEVGSPELIIMQMRENTDRNDLPIYDKAFAVQALIKNGLSDKEIAESLGWYLKKTGEEKAPDYNQVKNFRHALNLPDEAMELLRDQIIRDVVSAATLSKIYEIDPQKGSQLTQMISKQGMSRDRLLAELKKSKEIFEQKENGQGTDNQNEKPQKPKVENSSGKKEEAKKVTEIEAQTALPRILVEWHLKSAELIFDAETPAKQARIKMAKTGDEVTVDVSDLKILKIEY